MILRRLGNKKQQKQQISKIWSCSPTFKFRLAIKFFLIIFMGCSKFGEVIWYLKYISLCLKWKKDLNWPLCIFSPRCYFSKKLKFDQNVKKVSSSKFPKILNFHFWIINRIWGSAIGKRESFFSIFEFFTPKSWSVRFFRCDKQKCLFSIERTPSET